MGTLRSAQGDLITEICSSVAAGQHTLAAADISRLRVLTNLLVDVAGEVGQAELSRFQASMGRGLNVDTAALERSHRDKTIMVTGGTGCIGSSLLRQLPALDPRHLISVSRGVSTPTAIVDGVEYRHVDIRDIGGLNATIAELKPDVIYHLAAQHNPSLAEKEVARTLSTNVTGSANVFAAGRRSGAKVVHASTGKALRPFSDDIYAASKKMSEWLIADAMSSGELLASAARFTHVVDNSIIVDRFRGWTDQDLPIRLHASHISFYLQSALEAANLLMCVGLDAARGEMWLGAIRDLGWPISLVDLAVGWLSRSNGRSPIYVCGYEAGYEDNPYPALYDPLVSGDCSPLFNAMEASSVIESPHSPQVELHVVEPRSDERVNAAIRTLGRAAAAGAAVGELRAQVRECGWAMLEATVESVPSTVLARHLQLARAIPPGRFKTDDWAVVNTVRRELRRRTGGGVKFTDQVSPADTKSLAMG